MTLTTDQRRAIWERDQGICGICGEPVPWEDTDIDHAQPRALRGPTVPAPPLDVDVIEARHVPREAIPFSGGAVRFCRCTDRYPCDAALLVARVRALEAIVDGPVRAFSAEFEQMLAHEDMDPQQRARVHRWYVTACQAVTDAFA